jgi:large subunit ribosomal protein L18
MGFKKPSRDVARETRKARVRKRVKGTDDKPRLSVFRSLKYTYAQLISDESGRVLASASSKSVRADGKSARCVETSKEVGKKIAELAKEKNITAVVFDRNGYLYHGRVAAVAEGAREAGLNF